MIFGIDDRVRISSDSTAFSGNFVHIISSFADGARLQGSGVMIGSNDVLTAAHVFYSHEHLGFAESVKVTPAKFGLYEPFSSVYADNIYTTTGWTVAERFAYDYGVISLNEPIGFESGWLPFGAYSPLEDIVSGQTVTSFGYPGDKDYGNWLYGVTGTPDAIIYDNVLLFMDDLDTYFGQSGSPVLYSDPDSGDDEVVGVVSFHSYFPDSNGVLALTGQITDNISEWISLNNSSLPAPPPTPPTITEKIIGLYIAFFDRAPDLQGLTYWQDKADELSQQSDISREIAENFAQHFVFTSLYANTDNQSFVEKLYTNVLGSQGDAAGVANWKSLLDKGVSRAELVARFVDATLSVNLQGEAFADLSYAEYVEGQKRQDTFINKIEVSKAYLDNLSIQTNIINTQDIQNDPAYLASVNILSAVTNDDAATQETLNYLDSLQNDPFAIDTINQSIQLTGFSSQIIVDE
ncbi:MAG: DUF4214 domain-containing protein [Desulfobulbaceae bacterium]|nr:DUF4214 domain-containing protein [Desulfobulbaceae bacterium]